MATLKDVAARAGVSVATVSYCINKTHNLSAETRTRINQAISELNYIPNSQARSLKSQTSREICAIFPDLENLYYNEFLKGMLMQAENMNYSLNVSCSYNDMRKEQTLIENAISKNSAGILLVTCQPQNTAFFRNTLLKHKQETVFLDRMPSKIDAVYFGFDNYATVQYLTQRLINSNFRDIALLTGPDNLFSESECIAAFQDTMDEAGLYYGGKHQLTTDTTKEGAFKVSLQTWIDDPPQAIITSSQALCQGVIEACHLASLRIPEDICLITLDVDNWNLSSFYPNIIRTTRPAYALGAQSCQALIDMVEHSEKPENRFHLLRDTITNYPIRLPMPRNLNLENSDLSVGTLNIAAANLPTVRAIQAVSQEFYHKYHVRLNFDLLGLKELFTVITKDSQQEHPRYDIYLYDTSWFSYLFETGCLKDITDEIYSNPEMLHYFIPKNLSNCCRGNRYYGFPIIGGTQFLLYRRDLFSDQELGLKYKKNHKLSLRPPKTWKEFNAIARFFTRKYNPDSPTEYGTAIAMGLNEELALEFEPRLWSHGGSFFDTHGHLCLNSPQNARAMASFKESLRYSKPDIFSTQEAFPEFSKGNVAMIITFTEYAAQIQNSFHSEYLHKSGYSEIPGRTPVNVGWHLGVPKICPKIGYVTRLFHWLHKRHTSYYMSILSGASALEYPYKNHELRKLYPWMDLTLDAMDACRSRIYPLKKLNGYLPPHEFEAILCDVLRTLPDGSQDISGYLDTMQRQVVRALSS